MVVNSRLGAFKRAAFVLIVSFVAVGAPGCRWAQSKYQGMRGEGFSGWNEDMAGGVRGKTDAEPSGFFTDRRSDQIEKNLGGGF